MRRTRQLRRRRPEAGATAVEYALLLSLIFMAIVAVVYVLGDEVVALYTSVPGF